MASVEVKSESLTVRVPLAIKKRGGRKIIVSPDGQQTWAQSRPRVDNTLLRAVVQAFRWQHLLESGRFVTVSELAASEKLNGSYVSHVLRLTLLAPEIVEAILDGRQPASMQLQSLVKGFSLDWKTQAGGHE